MAAGEEKSSDFYAVLGLKKECTATELRNAYKNLALRWHPDRCSASGSSKFIEESKKKFQAIQEAYSVLSDANKRFMYDVGFYDCDDDENGMGDFLNEMAVMMSQNKSNENGETFEELQELFGEMFQSDLDGFGSTSQTLNPSSCSSSSYASCSGTSNANNKRNSFEMNSGNTKSESSSGFDAQFEGFCLGFARSSLLQLQTPPLSVLQLSPTTHPLRALGASDFGFTPPNSTATGSDATEQRCPTFLSSCNTPTALARAAPTLPCIHDCPALSFFNRSPRLPNPKATVPSLLCDY